MDELAVGAMTDPTEVTIGVFGRPDVSGALADRVGIVSPTSVIAAAEVAVPLVVQVIRHRVGDPNGASDLARIVGGIDPMELADPAAVFRTGRDVLVGSQLVDHLFVDANARSQAARAVTEGAGLLPGTGSELLAAAAWVVGAELHHRAGSPIDGSSLAVALEASANQNLPPAPTTALAPVVGGMDEQALTRSGSVEGERRAGFGRGDDSFDGRPVGLPAREPAAGLERSPEVVTGRPRRPASRGAVDDDLAVGSSGLVTGVAAFLGLLVVGLGVWWWFDRQADETVTSVESSEVTEGLASDDATDESATADPATDDGPAAEDGTEGAADEPAEDTSSGDTDTATPLIGPDGRASIAVAMVDPVGRTSASGTADLQFDPAASEICYEIGLDGVGAPADGHIHLGPAGVKGGIVVDFGPMSDGLTGCQPVPGDEIDAILADLDGHYVELHDPVEDFTVRAQLSEGTGPSGQPVAVPAGSDSADDVPAAEFDPDGGGAIAIIEPGRIVLRGAVADREAAERVLVDFAGLSELVVVDELTVEAGAPLPSGRVIVDSPATALFATDSDVLDPTVDPLIDQLVGLLEARPDWFVTVVGHTDSTGDDVANLELSLRRAEAVRQELIDGGVRSDRVRVRGAGSTDPLGDNTTIDGRAQNRRIEFEIER